MTARAARIEWMQAKDHAKHALLAIRQDAQRLRLEAKRQLGEIKQRYMATVAALKQRIRDARDTYVHEQRMVRASVSTARKGLAQRRLSEFQRVAKARARVNQFVTSGQRAAGQRLNEQFHEAMHAAESAIEFEHPELLPLFARWRNTGNARRAFSRALKTVRAHHKNRVPRPNEIGDAVAVHWMEQHVEQLDDNMRHVNESIERCMERAEKKIARLNIIDPYEYERRASEIWDECRRSA